MGNLSKNFDIRELVHPDIYNHPAIGDRAKDFIHPNLPVMLEAIKTATGDIITINDWLWNGDFINSGLRSAKMPLGKKITYSAHYFGTAADLKFKNKTPQEVYFYILNNQGAFPFITRMENIEYTDTWLHIEVQTDVRDGDIIIFNP